MAETPSAHYNLYTKNEAKSSSKDQGRGRKIMECRVFGCGKLPTMGGKHLCPKKTGRLKNVGATYQRAMVTLFHNLMHKEIEKYKLRLNPAKCTFGVKTGRLLGFVVNERGIKVDLDKVKAIREMQSLKQNRRSGDS
ncbi:hypothetical protein CR513_00520, partial [Mucuna pruriens]